MDVTVEFVTVPEIVFCQGCNEKFAVQADSRVCPQCGQTLTSIAETPTLDMADWVARGTYLPGADQADEDDAVLGTQLGVYEIESFLGKGGMARVYRAKHLTLERNCAIKVLNPQLAELNPQSVDMFLSEARAAASLVHPNVVTIHTIGHDRGLHYIEMEYVLGQTLQRYIECVGQPGPMRATHLMLQVATALAAAHRLNLVHRDIKPANVLLNEAGIAKLADFGLAKRVMGVGRFSKGHAPAGTPHYMSPELFDGHPADKRCDVYAMGVTFFYLLTGRLPFADRSFTDLAIRHAMDPVPDVLELCPDAPRDAIDIVNKCMAKEPSHRYEDAGQLVQEIRAVYGGLQCLESLVHEAVAELPIQVSGSANRYSLLVSLPGGRSQTVFVEACNAEPIAERVVKIYSLCGLASPNYFQRALELNASIPHGSIAIEPVEGKPYFVMCNTYPRSTCDVEEIRRSVQSIARHADDVEHFLTGNDRH